MKQLELPTQDTLVRRLHEVAQANDAVGRCVDGARSGVFVHPDGRRDPLDAVVLSLPQLALLCEISVIAPDRPSIDIGFGMGSSATTILGSREAVGRLNRHIAFDPYGLPDGRGEVVQAFLQETYRECFERIYQPSEIGLPRLCEQVGEGFAGLIFIDGSHTFENVIVDFMWADRLCCPGGYIVFDDADYPAIETAINYVSCNRPNYQVANRWVENTAVFKKTEAYDIPWYAFNPFGVADRSDWTKVLPAAE